MVALRKNIVIPAVLIAAFALYNLLKIIAVIAGFLGAVIIFIEAMRVYAQVLGVEVPIVPDISSLYFFIFLFAFGLFLLGYGVGKR